MVRARSVLFVSCASAENLNEISIHEGIRVAKPVALRAQSPANKIDDVKFLSRRGAQNASLSNRITYRVRSVKKLE